MNKITADIAEINPIDENTLVIIFNDNTRIETTQISFNSDGTFELGYIYE